MFSVSADTRERTALERDLHQGMESGLSEATKRGAVLTIEEAPERSGRLKKGIKPHVDLQKMRGEVEVSAIRPAQTARTETLALKSGRLKEVKFRAQLEHDYSRDLIEGTGLYGARGQLITPKKAKKLRFATGGNVTFAGSVKGQEPNPFPDRAADRLEMEAPDIVLNEVVKALL